MKRKKMLFKFSDQYKNVLMIGNGHIPAFLYCSRKPVLIDPGVSAFGPLYLKKVKGHFQNLESLLIVLTHAHFDHCGATPYLIRNIQGVKVAASLQAAHILKRPNAIALIKRLNAEYEQEMKDDLKGEDVSFEAICVDIELDDADTLELGDREFFKVMSTPGHTRDCLSYYLPDDGIVFTGESAGVFEDGFMHSPFLTSYEDYVSSLKKIIGLKPRALAVAHNGILTGEDAEIFLAESLKAAEDYKNMIADCLTEYNGDSKRVVEKITADEYDSQPNHIQKRAPFILNLEAKVGAVARLMENKD